MKNLTNSSFQFQVPFYNHKPPELYICHKNKQPTSQWSPLQGFSLAIISTAPQGYRFNYQKSFSPHKKESSTSLGYHLIWNSILTSSPKTTSFPSLLSMTNPKPTKTKSRSFPVNPPNPQTISNPPK